MQKKLALQVPVTVPKAVKNKKEFIVKATLTKLKEKEHLVLDIFLNKKKLVGKPVCRIFINDKEWMNYRMDNEEPFWTYSNLENLGYLSRDKVKGLFCEDNIIVSNADYTTICTYAKANEITTSDYLNNKRTWAKIVKSIQTKIAGEKEQRKYESRKNSLQKRCESVPELPEGFKRWAFAVTGITQHIIWYKRHGRLADYYCSHCGNEYTVKTKRNDSYEGQFEHIEPVPKHNTTTKCVHCGCTAQLKAAGKYQGYNEVKKEVSLVQCIDEKTMVYRHFYVKSCFGDFCINNGAEGPLEEHQLTEITRMWFKEGRNKVQQDYNKHNPYTGNDFWDDCNLYGMSNITYDDTAPLHPASFKEIKKGYMRYSALEEYMKHVPYTKTITRKPSEYLRLYHKYRCTEMLTKLHLIRLVNHLIGAWDVGVFINAYSKNAADVLRINKNRVRVLQEYRGDITVLRVLQAERKGNHNYSDEQLNKFIKYNITTSELGTATKYMGVNTFLNRIEKYTGVTEKSKDNKMLREKVHNTATTYIDYLEMRESMGYDMTNTVYLFPRNLTESHNELARLEAMEKDKTKKREKNKEFPEIQKMYKALCNRYMYTENELVIRPARNAAEIIDEGRILHHCVGGDSYLRSHNESRSFIFFLRFESTPDIPYYTIELKDGKINQYYAANDKQPNKDEIRKWLDKWLKMVQQRPRQTNQEEPEQIQLLQSAV